MFAQRSTGESKCLHCLVLCLDTFGSLRTFLDEIAFSVVRSVPGRATHDDRGLSRKEIIESVLQSLKNLQMDYIDLVLISKHDPNCPCEGEGGLSIAIQD